MKHVLSVALACALMALASIAGAQPQKAFRGRLSPMPLDLAMAATMTGQGTVTATLVGSTLTLNGTFEGLKSPATVARLHKGQRGVRGVPIVDLTISGATSGTVSATIDLTPAQVQDLLNNRLYVQLHSEKAPDGNLWGWLLPQETKR